MPVVAGGRLYLRDDDRLLCYNVRADALSRPRPDPNEIVISGIAETPPVRADDIARSPKSVFVPTPHDVVHKMLEVAKVKEDELVCDLGSGNGRIVIAAAEKFRARGIGYEIDGDLVAESLRSARLRKVGDRVTFEKQNIFQANLSDVDVVTLYLLPEQIDKLIPQLQTLKPGARIVSHQYPLPGIQPERWLLFDSEDDGHEHAIDLWVAPLTRSP